jgi:ribonuclease G
MNVLEEIENNVDFLMRQNKEKRLTVKVNPFVEAYLKKGIWNKPRQWFLKYRKQIKVLGVREIPFNSVIYLNSKGEEIRF